MRAIRCVLMSLLVAAVPLVPAQAYVPAPAPTQRSVPDLLRLADWCALRGHAAQERALLQQILEREPLHAEARRRLARAEPARAGEQRGDQPTPQTAPAPSTAVTAATVHARALEQEVNGLFAQLASAQPSTRDAALLRLREVATRESLPIVRQHAERVYRETGAFWRLRGSAIVELRPQTSTLVRMREFGTTLGVGNPVRFQLPETRSIGVGTTGIVPLGR